jgi:hypothetical protein
LVINNWVCISGRKRVKDGEESLFVTVPQGSNAEAYYDALQYSYPKFFKMDALCKWAWLGTEALLTANDGGKTYGGLHKDRIGVVLMTAEGCIAVDKKYQASIADIPSPALFVYTLPNIMLGELCIRHGFKGEQACLVSRSFDAAELHFWVSSLFENNKIDACLCGWVDATVDRHDVCLFWVTRTTKGYVFSPGAMQELYK